MQRRLPRRHLPAVLAPGAQSQALQAGGGRKRRLRESGPGRLNRILSTSALEKSGREKRHSELKMGDVASLNSQREKRLRSSRRSERTLRNPQTSFGASPYLRASSDMPRRSTAKAGAGGEEGNSWQRPRDMSHQIWRTHFDNPAFAVRMAIEADMQERERCHN